MLGQELAIDARLVVEALEERPRHQLDQILVARAIADEHRQVVGAFVAAVLRPSLLAAAGCHVELAPEDRLDPGLLGRQIEVDRAEEDRKSTRLNSSHLGISYAVFCLKKK